MDPNVLCVVSRAVAEPDLTSIDISNSTANNLQVRDLVHCDGDLSFNGRLLLNDQPFVGGTPLPPLGFSVGPTEALVAANDRIRFNNNTNVAAAGFSMLHSHTGLPADGDFRALQEGRYIVGFGTIDTPEKTSDETVQWKLEILRTSSDLAYGNPANSQFRTQAFTGAGLVTVYLRQNEWVSAAMGGAARTIKNSSKFVLQKVASAAPAGRLNGGLTRRTFTSIDANIHVNKLTMDIGFKNTLSTGGFLHSGDFAVPAEINSRVEYTGFMTVGTTGSYTFGLRADDAADLAVWTGTAWSIITSAHLTGVTDTPSNPGSITLTAGVPSQIRLRFAQAGGAAALFLDWKTPTNATWAGVPFSVFSCIATTPISALSIRDGGGFPEPRIAYSILNGSLTRRYFTSVDNNIQNTDSTMNVGFNNTLSTGGFLHASDFSVPAGDHVRLEYTGFMTVGTTGTYSLGLRGDDAADLAVWTGTAWAIITSVRGALQPTPSNPHTLTLTAGVPYYIRLRFTQATGPSALFLEWKTPTNATWAGVPFSIFSCIATTPITTATIRDGGFPEPRITV